MESLVSQADEKWSMILKYIEQSNGEGDGGRWTYRSVLFAPASATVEWTSSAFAGLYFQSSLPDDLRGQWMSNGAVGNVP